MGERGRTPSTPASCPGEGTSGLIPNFPFGFGRPGNFTIAMVGGLRRARRVWARQYNKYWRFWRSPSPQLSSLAGRHADIRLRGTNVQLTRVHRSRCY